MDGGQRFDKLGFYLCIYIYCWLKKKILYIFIIKGCMDFGKRLKEYC